MRLRPALRAAAALIIGLSSVFLASQPASAAAPPFQMPFPCGQAWNGDSDNSSAHVSWEIDFNRGSTAYADLGDTVVAAAAGTVEVSADQGELNGYGNLIVINHGGGYYTYYAHLDKRAVTAGQSVLRGQAIGAVGNTSRSGNAISPHLHFEVRYPDRSQSHIIKSVFNGTTFGYPNSTPTSHNCATQRDPATVCGSGFEMTDSVKLGTAGTVNLLWKGSTSQNCVVTLKMSGVGTATATSAFLEPQGSTRTTDSGNFSEYAGPVVRTAPNCVKWGGSTGGSSYTSPFEHC
ncbi:M23 family metallopeptidase [Longispora sp. K20-0274]|uniref:M23 family metallopeptidase n=1 Tax=Longispora sp. K20-0274 TaxID=3088255 RepID=UPI00399B00D2